MSIDFNALRGTPPGKPLDGIQTAILQRVDIFEGNGKKLLKTEWSGYGGTYWESVDSFKPTDSFFPRTQEMVSGLGVNLDTIASEAALLSALTAAIGRTFQVRVEVNGQYYNTWIESSQQALDVGGHAPPAATHSDVPADVDWRAAVTPADDDIPF